jgi:hypothetical protein
MRFFDNPHVTYFDFEHLSTKAQTGANGSQNGFNLNRFFSKVESRFIGTNGFRMSHYSFDENSRTWLINGMSFKGYRQDQIIKWLGKPGDSGLGKEDKLLIMSYPVRQGTSEPDKALIIYFDSDNNLDDIIQETGMQK